MKKVCMHESYDSNHPNLMQTVCDVFKSFSVELMHFQWIQFLHRNQCIVQLKLKIVLVTFTAGPFFLQSYKIYQPM